MFFQDSKRQNKTMKKTRRFMVDGVEVSVTTSKIVTDNDAKSEEMRFLRYARELVSQIKSWMYDPNRLEERGVSLPFASFVLTRHVAEAGRDL